jgi:hypothetical protein
MRRREAIGFLGGAATSSLRLRLVARLLMNWRCCLQATVGRSKHRRFAPIDKNGGSSARRVARAQLVEVLRDVSSGMQERLSSAHAVRSARENRSSTRKRRPTKASSNLSKAAALPIA